MTYQIKQNIVIAHTIVDLPTFGGRSGRTA
jgi:hypothetical protein